MAVPTPQAEGEGVTSAPQEAAAAATRDMRPAPEEQKPTYLSDKGEGGQMPPPKEVPKKNWGDSGEGQGSSREAKYDECHHAS